MLPFPWMEDLLAASFAFLLFGLSHVLLWRWRRLQGYAMLLLLAGLSFWPGLSLASQLGLRLRPEGAWVAGAVYLFGLMLYLHFYSGILRSLSVRILGELAKAPGQELSLEDLERHYPQEVMFQERVAQLLRIGWLLEEEGQLRVSTKGARWARLQQALGRLYRQEVTG